MKALEIFLFTAVLSAKFSNINDVRNIIDGHLCLLSSEEFIKYTKDIVYDYANSQIDKTDNVEFSAEDVYVVWYNFTLGNPKALFSTNLPDGMYCEVTYNANRDEIYFDAYKKWINRCISLEEIKKKIIE